MLLQHVGKRVWFSCTCLSVGACVLWYLRASIQPYYPGINYGVDAGMQAVLANKLPLHPSVPVTLPVPSPTRRRIICPELQVLVIYVAAVLAGTHTKKEKEIIRGEAMYI